MQAALSARPIDMEGSPSHEELVQWFAAVGASQDRKAFEALYTHFAPKVKRYLLRQGAPEEHAEELAQETMVQVWRKAHQYDAAKAVPGAWVYRVARNLRIDRLRRQRFYEVDIDQVAEQADDAYEGDRATDRIDGEQLLVHVEALPAEQRQIVTMAYLDGLSQSEIGVKLDLPLGTVKSRLRLAFGKLRKVLGEQV
jgi:RNA polymerase sigma-70 factor (ECF subfamily)